MSPIQEVINLPFGTIFIFFLKVFGTLTLISLVICLIGLIIIAFMNWK